MTPTLPKDDPRPEHRARGLAKAREDYAFRHDYHEIVAAASLPLREKDDVGWYAAVAAVSAKLEVNKLAIGPVQGNDYRRMYATIAAPPVVDVWQRDDVFAWQAVAGANPYMLRRFARPDPRFPMTEAHFARAGVAGDTLARAMAEGRLYLADYAVLDGLPVGTVDGLAKYNFAPLALYVWRTDTRALAPVAIQTGQKPGDPLLTPGDGVSWMMARACVTTADGNYQGIISHFALCHQVMESVILAARRQLASAHPLLVLLSPHFQNTLITNDIAMTNLIGAGGYMERLQSPTLDASLALATRAIRDFRLTESAPREDAVARGVDDLATLGDYPARDDAYLVWDATLPFVDAYVRLYYPTDADVSGDVELAAWVDEMGADDGGRLTGLERPRTVAALVDLIARIVFRCTAHHASINYPSFDFFSYAPNMQTAAFGPGPTGGAGDTDAALAAMIPPYAQAYQAFYLFEEITLQLNRIGEYPKRHFDDDRVAPVLDAYRTRLDAVERAIDDRNASRRLAYPYQLPSRISLSIHV
jgi:arachidonate 15-lipoxygenase